MPQLRMMSMLALGAGLAAALVAAQPPGSPDPTYRWEGSVRIVQHGPVIGGEGEVTTYWDLNVRWREARRVDVRAAGGRVVGQVVFLEDDGSGWTASRGGTVENVSSCSRTTFTFTGSGSGTSTIRGGWIYWSLVDDDPLVDVLPSGAYHVDGDSSQKLEGVMDFESVDCRGGTMARTNPYPGMPLVLDIGRHSLTTLQPPPSGFFTVESLRGLARAHQEIGFPDLAVRALDSQARFVEDGVMRGSYRTVGHDVGEGRLYWEASWDVRRRMAVDVRLARVDPAWRPCASNPEASSAAAAGGCGPSPEPARVRAAIETPAGVEGRFRFFLEEVSREPGVAINRQGPEGDGLDLEFAERQEGFDAPVAQGEDGWLLEGTEAASEVTVLVEPDDFGAWGRLRCAVVIEGQEYDCRTEDGAAHVNVPLDRDDNRIADAWEARMGVSGEPAADDDPAPDGREPGDGLSSYEEYRGVFVGGEWIDLDPRRKDLFVRNAIGDSEIVEAGILTLEEATGLTVHRIRGDEYEGDDTRVVNHRRGSYAAREDGQRALLLEAGTLSGEAGVVRPIDPLAPLGSPNVVHSVVIDHRTLSGNAARAVTVVAHELGHGINLWHPGSFDTWDCDADGYSEVVALQGGAGAGPLGNLMRYNRESFNSVMGPDGVCRDYPEYDDVHGAALVETLQGDGFNGGPPRVDDEGRPLPLSGDATCAGTLRTSLSIGSSETSWPAGC